ncbi:MAG: preprotein translocase subunit SecY [Nanoarchaeota archaeon]
MGVIDSILLNLPEVSAPKQKRLSFKEKLKWTLIVLILFFVLGLIELYGLGAAPLRNFEFLSVILGASFGSIISLGIGPIVTASIVLQLLNGSGLMKFDLTTHEGKQRFQGLQKLLSIAFIIFEAGIFVMLGGLSPAAGIPPLVLIFQLILGGFLILFMDEIVSKWGFGSGISLFIAAGVAQHIFVRAFSPFKLGSEFSAGAIPALFQALGAQNTTEATLRIASMAATIVMFAIVVYAQSMKVEIPLSFGRIRGHGIRWPLSFMYTSVIPVILIAAFMANIQLFASILGRYGYPLGNPQTGSGLIGYLSVPGGQSGLIGLIIRQGTIFIGWEPYAKATVYMLFFLGGAVLFSWFWVQTAGLDARSQAKQMMASGLQIPGFRRDERVLERMLERYIKPLTIMGGIAIGFLAALADLSGALTSGTGLLLTVSIVYKLYEEIAQQHVMDMNPMMRKFMGK